MGRGRAKAKQQKVARELKYQTGGSSIEALREELGAAPTPTDGSDDGVDGEYVDDYDPYDSGKQDDDPYAELANRYAQDSGEGRSPERG